MSVRTLFIYILSSIILSIILNRLEENKKDNLIDYIVISNIYILVLSGIFDFYELTNNSDNIFFIILFLVLGKIFYMTLIKERTILKNNDYNLKKYLFTLGSSYLINILLINQVDHIFPSMETIKLLVWLFMIGYVLLYIKKNIDLKVPTNNNISFYQDREYIVMQYAKYKNLYGNIVSSKYFEVNLLLFAIMIYENYNKPELIRRVDLFKYKLFHEEGKFGIMQIEKKYPITNEDSIEIAKKKLEKIYANSKVSGKEIVRFLIRKYYREEKKEIEAIYQIIYTFIK